MIYPPRVYGRLDYAAIQRLRDGNRMLDIVVTLTTDQIISVGTYSEGDWADFLDEGLLDGIANFEGILLVSPAGFRPATENREAEFLFRVTGRALFIEEQEEAEDDEEPWNEEDNVFDDEEENDPEEDETP